MWDYIIAEAHRHRGRGAEAHKHRSGGTKAHKGTETEAQGHRGIPGCFYSFCAAMYLRLCAYVPLCF